MTPYGIVYKDNLSSLNEGSEIWRKKSDIISKKALVVSLLLISLSIIAVNFIIFQFRTDKEFYSLATLILTAMEIVSVFFLLKSTLRRNVKNIFTTSSTKGLKQAVLRENEIEFSTPMSKSNYFYEEIEEVVEGVNSVNIIVEKENLPVCISKSGIEKGEIESFILILKEKMKDKYSYEGALGGKSL